MSRYLYIYFVTLVLNTRCIAQAITYFKPEDESDYHTYTTFAPNGSKGMWTLTRGYTTDNSKCLIKDVTNTDRGVASITERVVYFRNNEVLIKKFSTINILGMNRNKTFDPPKILLKLPKANETVSWISGETGLQNTAKYVIRNIDGERIKCLAVTEYIFNTPTGKVYEVSYYYPGIGFARKETLKNGVSTLFMEIDK